MVACSALVVLAVAGVTLAAGQVTLVVDGRAIQPDVLPQIVNGRVLVPVRWVAEALGATVDWDGATRTVKVTSAGVSGEQGRLFEAALAPRTAAEAAMKWAEGVRTGNTVLQRAVSALALKSAAPWRPAGNLRVATYQVESIPDPAAGPEPAVEAFTIRFTLWSNDDGKGGSAASVEVRRFDDLPGKPWLVTSAGDAGDTLGAGTVLSGTPAPGAIPFLAVERSELGDELGLYPIRRAEWDLERARLVFGGVPVFHVKDADRRGWVRVAWDGGGRIVLTSQPGLEISVASRLPGSRVEEVATSWGLDLVAADSSREETVKITRSVLEGDTELEIRKGTEVRRLALMPDLGAGVSLLRPIAAHWAGDQLKMYFETAKSSDRGPVSGLVEATYSGNTVRWRVIAQDLEITEAGAGTRMVKVGGAIFIGCQDRKVFRVDIATGEVEPCSAIDDALQYFQERYANRTEAATPPSMYAYGDTLIISWEPPALREEQVGAELWDRMIPVRCILAVKNGDVVGRMFTAGGNTMVLKGDSVTQVIRVEDPNIPQWIFPR
ncbi:MAG: copper amine oxidase N-terminal domain-containing protein [Firmicutes bacterium]|nr:copper amine oxidase N-terminal domain-containing protein [Bacillota bacterium]